MYTRAEANDFYTNLLRILQQSQQISQQGQLATGGNVTDVFSRFGMTPTSEQVTNAGQYLTGYGAQLAPALTEAQRVAMTGIYSPDQLQALQAAFAQQYGSKSAGERQALFGTLGGGAGGRVRAALGAGQSDIGTAASGGYDAYLRKQNAESRLAGMQNWGSLLGQSGNLANAQVALGTIPTNAADYAWGDLQKKFEDYVNSAGAGSQSNTSTGTVDWASLFGLSGAGTGTSGTGAGTSTGGAGTVNLPSFNIGGTTPTTGYGTIPWYQAGAWGSMYRDPVTGQWFDAWARR